MSGLPRNVLRCLSVAAVFAMAGTATARVEVAGGINADTVWRAADAPYVVTGELIVRAGATLTIEPGTEVQIGDNLRIVIEGSLVSVGEGDNPVVIRGEREIAGAWNRLELNGGSLTMQHTRVAHANYGLYLNRVPTALDVQDSTFTSYGNTGIYMTGAGVGPYAFEGVTLDGSNDDNNTGFYSDGARIEFRGGFVAHNLYGMRVRNERLTLQRTVIWDNSSRGVEVYTSTDNPYSVSISRCTFYGQQAGTAIYAARSRNFRSGLTLSISRSIFQRNNLMVQNGERDYPITFSSFSQNVYTRDNSTFSGLSNPGNFGTSLEYDALLVDPENGDFEPTDRSPARYFDPDGPANTVGAIDFAGAETGDGLHGFWYVNRVFEPETVYDVAGDVVVAPGVTMNFRPGTEFRMAAGADLMNGGLDRNRIEIRVEGTLEADGTNSRPVSFTSAADEPAPGDWYGIVIPSGAEAFNVAQVELGWAWRGVSLYQNDHIVAGSRVFSAQDAGIWIQGGTPQIEEVIVEDSQRHGIYMEGSASVPITETTIRRSVQTGIYSTDSEFNLSDSLVHDNDQYGIYAYTNVDNDPKGINLNHVTVAHNGRDGVYTRRARNFRTSMSLSLRSSSITHNGGPGASSNERDYPTTFSCTSSNLWGNTTGVSGFTLGSSCFEYNPLYADIDNRNYQPTRWSPNRGLGIGGSHVGAIPWDDAIGPHIMGYLWEDYTFTRQDSPYPVLGDIVVPAGVNVTFEPGAELRVAAQEDGMGGGLSRNRAEIRVLGGATVTMGLPVDDQPDEGIGGQPVLIRSNAAQPANGDWYGLHFTNGETSSIYNVEVRHPTSGLVAEGPGAPRVRYLRVLHHNNYGLYFNRVRGASDIDVHGAFVVGPRRGSGSGLHIIESDGVVQSSYFTHHANGAYVYTNEDNVAHRVYLTNNTFVKHNTGIYWSRASNFRTTLRMDIHNNIVADNSSYALRDGQNRNYPTTESVTNNNLFGTNRIDATLDTNQNNITTDPNVEDIDWDDAPRWWDGQVWPESLAIDAGSNGAPNRPAYDILGRPRIIGNTVDIGAWEHDPDANVEPRADPVTDSIMVPRNESFVFDGSEAFDPDGRIASAFWTMSDGTVTAGQTVEHTFNTQGEGQWGYITVVDDDGAEDHARVLVNVNIRPIADAGPAVFQDEGPEESVFFDGTLSVDPDGQIVRWEWDFGDGSPLVAQQSPRHSYLSAGLYTVRLTVTDNEGLTDTDTTIATVFGNVDIVGPLVEHNELADGLPVGQDVEIRATIRDPAGVQDAVLFYRGIGDQAAQFALMQPQGGDIYSATIPGDRVDAPGVEYWIVARDGVEGEPNTSTYPIGAPADDVWDFLVVGDRDPPVIVHQPVADGQAPGEPVTVSATISDDTGIGSAVLFFRSQGSQVFGATNMARVQGDVWSGQIPAFVVGEAGVEYYIAAEDASPIPNQAASPADAPATLYSFTVQSSDQQPPVIVHQQVPDDQVEGAPVTVDAGIVDAESAVASAAVVYRAVGAQDWLRAPMMRVDGNTWRGQIPGEAVVLAGVQYYVEATDAADNVATDPPQAPVVAHVFSVSAEDRIGPEIDHRPIADGQPENEDVLIEATAADPAGVASMRVSYRPAGFPFFNDVQLVEQDEVWVGLIPGFAVAAGSMEYYLRATDGEGNFGYFPAGGQNAPLTFTVGSADEVGPTIVHDPVADGRTVGQPLDLEVSAFDDAGVASVLVWHRVEGEDEFTELSLERGQNSRWAGVLDGEAVALPGVEYYIVATDASQAGNTARLPEAEGEFFAFSVAAPDEDGPEIVHAPSVDPLPRGVPFVVTATVTDQSEIAAVQLRWAIDDGVFRTRDMALGAGDAFATTIAPEFIPAGSAAVRYYITATDAVGNAATLPVGGEDAPFVQPLEQRDEESPLVEVALGAGVEQPVIAGTPTALEITALDDRGVIAVRVEITVGGDQVADLPAAPAGADTWSVVVPGNLVVEPDFVAMAVASDAAGNVGRSEPLAVDVLPPPDVTAPVVTLARVPDGQLEGQAVTVTAEIVDAVGVAGATLSYRAPGGMWSPVVMAAEGPLWRGTIPGAAVAAPAVEYYVEAADAAGNVGVDPDATAQAPARFTVTEADEAGPAIGHVAPAGPLNDGEPLTLSISVEDASGVAGVSVWWRVDDGAFLAVNAVRVGEGRYEATVGPLAAPAIEYYIEADDSVDNTSRLPLDGSFRVGVVVPDRDAPTIEHAPPAEAVVGEGLLIGAVVTDPSGVDAVILRYRQIGNPAFGEVPLVAGDDDTWAGAIPGFLVNAPGVEYYLVATDAAGNSGTLPADAPGETFRVAVGGGDVEPPLVVHDPVQGPLPAGEDLAVEALVEDDTGVASVSVYFRAQGAGVYLSAELIRQDDISWLGRIPGLAIQPPAVEYYIVATDLAGNRGFVPAEGPDGPIAVPVEGEAVDEEPPAIELQPVADERPVGVEVDIAAIITDAGVVAGATAHVRVAGTPDFVGLPMIADGDAWTARIPGALVQVPGMEYYVEARDAAGNTARAPVPGPAAPATFSVVDPDADAEPPTIVHAPILVEQATGVAVPIEAVITDAGSGVDRAVLYFRRPADNNWLSAVLAAGPGDVWTGAIPAFAVTQPAVQYYIEAIDVAGNTAVEPTLAPAVPHLFPVQAPREADPPVIDHDPIEGPVEEGVDLRVEARVTDASGLARVEVRVRREGNDNWLTVALEPQGGDDWGIDIPGDFIVSPGIEYYLRAVDAGDGVEATDPAGAPGAFHSVVVGLPDEEGPVIALEMLPESVSAGTPVPVVATITDESGVDSARLQVYSSATESWTTFDLLDEGGDRYTGVIPAALSVEPELLVVVEATDGAGNVSLDPADGQADPYVVTVEVEAEADPPMIVHSPAASGDRDLPLPVSAIVTDASGVDEVTVFFREGGTDDWLDREMTADGDDRYAADIPAAVTRGAFVEYYITAVDTLGNAASDPGGAPEMVYAVELRGEEVEPDMGPDEADMAPDPEPEADMGEVDVDMGSIPEGDMGGSDGDDDTEPTGCTCDVDDGGAPASLLALFGLLLAIRPRRRR